MHGLDNSGFISSIFACSPLTAMDVVTASNIEKEQDLKSWLEHLNDTGECVSVCVAFDKSFCIVVVSTFKQTQGQLVEADVQHLCDAFVCSQNELCRNLIICFSRLRTFLMAWGIQHETHVLFLTLISLLDKHNVVFVRFHSARF